MRGLQVLPAGNSEPQASTPARQQQNCESAGIPRPSISPVLWPLDSCRASRSASSQHLPSCDPDGYRAPPFGGAPWWFRSAGMTASLTLPCLVPNFGVEPCEALHGVQVFDDAM